MNRRTFITGLLALPFLPMIIEEANATYPAGEWITIQPHMVDADNPIDQGGFKIPDELVPCFYHEGKLKRSISATFYISPEQLK